MNLAALPGGDLVEAGLADLAAGRESIAALLVSIASSRLRDAGFEVATPIPDARLRLYHRLAEEDEGSAHGRFNALVRRLVSFERAAECVK
jgi:hypothetical protein